MQHSHQRPKSLIAAAAALRAAGDSWDTIAKQIGRSAERIRRWPRLYGDAWAHHFRRAETHYLAEAAVEARQLLRLLLRSKKDRTRLIAAQSLLKGRITERAAELIAFARQPNESEDDPELKALICEARNFTDEELDEAIQNAKEEFAAFALAEKRGADAGRGADADADPALAGAHPHRVSHDSQQDVR